MTNLTQEERTELENLRRSAYKFISDPLERAFFELESILENPYSTRVDAIMPASAFRVLARALILLKQELKK